MTITTLFRLAGALARGAVTAALALLVFASSGHGQWPDALHTTHRTWDEQLWLDLLDRNSTIDGHLSDLGVLKRWHRLLDRKYFLDLAAIAPHPLDDYSWHRRASGVRWLGTSVTKRDLANIAEFKARVNFAETWRVAVRFDRVALFRVNRAAVRVAIEHDFSESWTVMGMTHLDVNKPGSDIGFGTRWQHKSGEIRAEVVALDVANNFIYVGLDAVGDGQVDSTIQYDNVPWGFRGSVDQTLGRHFRLEAYGAWLPNVTARVLEGSLDSTGFRTSERTWYAGGFLEWTPSGRFVVDLHARAVDARSSRAYVEVDRQSEDYELEETTSAIGIRALGRLGTHWIFDVGVDAAYRPEVRAFSDPARSNIDYRLNTVRWHVTGTYRRARGLTADATVEGYYAREPNGNFPSKGPLETDVYRIRLNAGWTSSESFGFMVGGGMDLQPTDRKLTTFGGARGRFYVYW